jgi:hypothetical protein
MGVSALLLGMTFAAGVVGADSSVSFGVQKSNEGDSQGRNAGYFDLVVKPGDELTIETKVFNRGQDAIDVVQQLFSAYTNASGSIDNSSKAKKYDPSLTTKLTDIAAIHASDIKVELAAGETRLVKVTIKIPETAPDGVILGSWYFSLADDQAVKAGAVPEGISNRYGYAIGIKLTVNKEIAKPNLNLTSVTTGEHDYQKAIFANFQNDQRAILSQLKITAKVTKRGAYEVLYQQEMPKVTMAPNSNYALPIKLGKEQMKAGTYTMRVKAETTDPKWPEKTWTWDMDFTVLKADADAANQAAIRDPKAEPFPWLTLVIALGLLLILLIILLFILLWKRSKKEDDETETNQTPSQTKAEKAKKKNKYKH